MAKKRGRPRTRRDAPGADAGPGHNSGSVEGLSDNEQRALFARDRDAYIVAKTKLDTATADLRNVRKRILADGFTVIMVQDAIAIASPEGEAKVRDELRRRLTVARWFGMELGLAANAEAAAAGPSAFEAGKLAGFEGRMRQPPYPIDAAGYEQWMNGYYEGNAALLKGGLKAPAEAPDAPAGPAG